MTSFFNAAFFSNNRAQLRARYGSKGPIVIAGNGLLQRGADSAYAFCQDANFWYLTGIDEPDLILVMDGDDEYIIVPPRDASRMAFDGAVDDTALTKRSGVVVVLETAAGWRRLAAGLAGVSSVAVVAAAPGYIEHYGLYANPARARLARQLKARRAGLELVNISEHIINLRMIKQAPELAALQAAIDITLNTIAEATTMHKYDHEYQLEAEISRGFRSRGASGHAFDPIVAGGVRACTLHNVANNGAFKTDELVVIDVGAEVEHYAADITRTICLGQPTARQRAVHAAVADVQTYALSLLRPGVMMAEYEQQVADYMGQTLIKLGLFKKSTSALVRRYYPHATSHFLGLNVHDAGDYRQPLQAGMVITVEPGIYITEEAIGVRIEDDVLITPTGATVLSRRLSGQLA